jgi:hypothetical protein
MSRAEEHVILEHISCLILLVEEGSPPSSALRI